MSGENAQEALEIRRMLADSARAFVEGDAAAHARAWRSKPEGYDGARWRQMAELGWAGLLAEEAHGGAGLGLADAAELLAETGRGIGPEPLTAMAVLAVRCLQRAGGPGNGELIAALASGARTIAVAWQEKAGDMAAQDCDCAAAADGDDALLTGAKDYVHGGAQADAFIVSARSAGGVGLYLVARGAPGVKVETRYFTDGTTCDRLTLDKARVAPGQIVGPAGGGEAALDFALEETRIALSAELLGCARAAFDMTIDYLKTRKQFGKPIGSFQALQHRAVDLFVQLQIMRSAVDRAARAAPAAADARELALIASACKARCGDGGLQIAREAIQMHGAIGYTDEHDIGLYVRRALVLSAWAGNSAQHRKRVCALSPALDLV